MILKTVLIGKPMLRLALCAVFLAVSTGPISSDANCDNAYVRFVERLDPRVAQLSGNQLAILHRKALRILDACDSGHLDRADALFRALEKS